MALAEIKNYIQLTPLVGTSGQPKAGQFENIVQAGFDAVVNLALADSDHAIADEGSLVTSLGMSYFHIPVKFDAPTTADLDLFCGVMQALDGKKVWVHCVVNARVSAFMFHYLTKFKNLPAADARSAILDKWQPRMDDAWREFMAL